MDLNDVLATASSGFHPVVDFDPGADKLLAFNFTAGNTELNPDIIRDTNQFSQYISHALKTQHCRYGIGGYNEHRTLYARSSHFDTDDEPRRLHLGIDIWGEAGTPVYAPLNGHIHSFQFNDRFGDYGATIIVQHELDSITFYTLYGHLNLAALQNIKEGQPVEGGQPLAAFGLPHENGQWPPHLHFQVIRNMQGMKGDYPGVCKFSERESYLKNCPDPDLILQMNQYIKNI